MCTIDKLCFPDVSARESSQSETKSLYLGAVLNADSIYSTSYAALCLSLKLALHGFYSTRDKTCIPVSEVGTHIYMEKGPADITNSVDQDQSLHFVENIYMYT